MKELSHCPECKFDFNGEDIYKHFFDKYTKEIDSYPYFKTVEQILESIKNYPGLYKDFPPEDELRKMSKVELNALETANCYGWTKKNPKCFKKYLGIEIQGYYDGIVLYQCLGCGHKIKRFDWVDDKYLIDPKKVN